MIAAVVVPGCATGNGFERIDPRTTRRIVGVDLNPEFLELARKRHAARLPGLELIRGDLAEVELEAGAFDFVFAGLIFEYVEPAPLLARCARWLRRGGVLGTALQLPCVAGKVSASAYPSLERLAPPAGEHDVAALGDDAAGDGKADAPARPRDDRHRVGEACRGIRHDDSSSSANRLVGMHSTRRRQG